MIASPKPHTAPQEPALARTQTDNFRNIRANRYIACQDRGRVTLFWLSFMLLLCHIALFNGLRVSIGERQITRFRTRKAALLLARLALDAQLHERAALIEWLWPDCELSVGRNRLSVTLSALRRDVGAPIFAASHDAVGLDWQCVTTDIAAFRALTHRAREGGDEIASLRAALELFAGPPLSGVDDDSFEPHLRRLRGELSAAACRFAALPQSDDDFALATLRRVSSLELLDEMAARATMQVLARAQGAPAALLYYAEFEKMTHSESGQALTPATRQLARELQSQLAASSDAETSPLGASATTETRFFGRAREIETLTRQLQNALESGSSEGRVITLTGGAGYGKTRLARAAVQRLSAVWPGAICFVPLAPVREAAQITDALLMALELPRSHDGAHWPRVAEALRARPTLLVLDNMEHLVGTGATWLHRLAREAPTTVCLLTSRRALKLPGEREIAVAPLSVPDARDEDAIADSASVQMLVARIQTTRAEFALNADNARVLAQICVELQGVPLAIELAAARAAALSPAEILAGLQQQIKFLRARPDNGSAGDSAPAHHSSLRATLGWSTDLLPTELAHLLMELSVFRGGWTLESAAEVCQAPRSATPFWWAESHQSLGEHSLLLRQSDAAGALRFSLLESVRQFAQGKLGKAARRALERRHALYFTRIAERAASERREPGLLSWRERLRAEQPNLRAALSWALEHDAALAVRLGAALWWFWFLDGQIQEARDLLRRALENDNSPDDSFSESRNAARAEAWCGAAFLAWRHGDLVHSIEFAGESLKLCRADSSDSAALTKLESASNQRSEAYALIPLQLAHIVRGEFDLALECSERSLALCRALGDQYGQAFSLHLSGSNAEAQGDLARAWSLQEQSRALFEVVGAREGVAYALFNRGSVERRRGDAIQSLASCRQSQKLFEQLGNREGAAYARFHGALTLLSQRRRAPARRELLESLREFQTLGLRWGLALAIEAWSELEMQSARPDAARATRLWSAAAQVRAQIGASVPPVDSAHFAEFEAQLRAALDAPAFEAAWANGRALTLKQVIDSLAS